MKTNQNSKAASREDEPLQALSKAGFPEVQSLTEDAKERLNLVVECKDLMMMYSCAMKEVQTRFEILNSEYNVRCQRNPIQTITTRLKGSASIVEKLSTLNVPFSAANIKRNIHDVAGVRVICCYVDDIYELARAMGNQDGIELVEVKDYISNPKPNGYRSLHLILNVSVSFATCVRMVTVEVQIRTIAMDFWASLEHQLKYKNTLPNEREIVRQLTECAEIIAQTDSKMEQIRRQIEANTSTTADDVLLDKLKKMDHPL